METGKWSPVAETAETGLRTGEGHGKRDIFDVRNRSELVSDVDSDFE